MNRPGSPLENTLIDIAFGAVFGNNIWGPSMKASWDRIKKAINECPSYVGRDFERAYDERDAFRLLMLMDAAIALEEHPEAVGLGQHIRDVHEEKSHG